MLELLTILPCIQPILNKVLGHVRPADMLQAITTQQCRLVCLNLDLLHHEVPDKSQETMRLALHTPSSD